MGGATRTGGSFGMPSAVRTISPSASSATSSARRVRRTRIEGSKADAPWLAPGAPPVWHALTLSPATTMAKTASAVAAIAPLRVARRR